MSWILIEGTRPANTFIQVNADTDYSSVMGWWMVMKPSPFGDENSLGHSFSAANRVVFTTPITGGFVALITTVGVALPV